MLYAGAMVVPGMIGCGPNSTIGKQITFEVNNQVLLNKLDLYTEWAKTEPRIAGFAREFGRPLSLCRLSCTPLQSGLGFPSPVHESDVQCVRTRL